MLIILVVDSVPFYRFKQSGRHNGQLQGMPESQNGALFIPSGIVEFIPLKAGHSNVQTTMIYIHVAAKNRLGVKSPLDDSGSEDT